MTAQEKFLTAWNGDYKISKDYYVIRTGERRYLERLEINIDNAAHPITKISNTIAKAATFTDKEKAEKIAFLADGILEGPF